MSNTKLFKDAIADAKALREVAVANAKAALEESFSPKIQSMFEKRVMEADEELEEIYDAEENLDLVSMNEEEEIEEGKDELEESEEIEEGEDIDLEELFNSLSEEDDDMMETEEDAFMEGDYEDEEDYNLDEILAELEEAENEINEEDELEEGSFGTKGGVAPQKNLASMNVAGKAKVKGLKESEELNESFMDFFTSAGLDDPQVLKQFSSYLQSQGIADSKSVADLLTAISTMVAGGATIAGFAGLKNLASKAIAKIKGKKESINENEEEPLNEIMGTWQDAAKLLSDILGNEVTMMQAKQIAIGVGGSLPVLLGLLYAGGSKLAEWVRKIWDKIKGKDGGDEMNESTMFEKATGDEEISEVTVDELRDMIQDAIKAALGDAEEGEDEEMDMDMDMGDEEGEEDMDLDIDMDAEEGEDEEKDDKKDKKKDDEKLDERKRYKMAMKDKAELNEAINTIKVLRDQLNEVNLLNAKLIYVNKIFKANTLNESQKVKVVNSFDKAKTLNEAKNIYEVLKDNLGTSKKAKAPLRESKQFASAVIGGKSASQPIVADDMVTRMQKLAGIIQD